MAAMKLLPAAPVGSNCVLGQCAAHTLPAQQTRVELRSVKWQTSDMLAASFAQSGRAIVTQRCSESSLSVCVFASRTAMRSLYLQEHVPAHFDKPVQLILFWLQCDLRSTFARKLLIAGTLEHWMNQQREYFCLLIKGKSKAWTLASSSFSTLSSRSRTCFINVCTMFLMFLRQTVDWFQKTQSHYTVLACVWWSEKWCNRMFWGHSGSFWLFNQTYSNDVYTMVCWTFKYYHILMCKYKASLSISNDFFSSVSILGTEKDRRKTNTNNF